MNEINPRLLPELVQTYMLLAQLRAQIGVGVPEPPVLPGSRPLAVRARHVLEVMYDELVELGVIRGGLS